VIRAVEFFSGIGAFAESVGSHCKKTAVDTCRKGSTDYDATLSEQAEIVAAFDQNADANATYSLNFGLKPISRNLDSIKSADIPAADLWWMSPPCTPFSRRGNRLDLQDNRSAAFRNLLILLPQHRPELFFMENVTGFIDSSGEQLLTDVLSATGYRYSRVSLCPSLFGVPCLRPRVFYVACTSERLEIEINKDKIQRTEFRTLADYLDREPDPRTFLEPHVQERYQQGFDIVDATRDDARAICFTSGYARTMKVGGSFLSIENNRLRRFSPGEIVRLLGFSNNFQFPPEISWRNQWKLAGNSVDITCLRFLFSSVGLT
jgi:site-specific DNA-cytosine methylase